MNAEVEQLYRTQLGTMVKSGNEEKKFDECYKDWWIIFYSNDGKEWSHLLTITQHIEDIGRKLRKPFYKAQILGELIEVK